MKVFFFFFFVQKVSSFSLSLSHTKKTQIFWKTTFIVFKLNYQFKVGNCNTHNVILMLVQINSGPSNTIFKHKIVPIRTIFKRLGHYDNENKIATCSLRTKSKRTANQQEWLMGIVRSTQKVTTSRSVYQKVDLEPIF